MKKVVISVLILLAGCLFLYLWPLPDKVPSEIQTCPRAKQPIKKTFNQQPFNQNPFSQSPLLMELAKAYEARDETTAYYLIKDNPGLLAGMTAGPWLLQLSDQTNFDSVVELLLIQEKNRGGIGRCVFAENSLIETVAENQIAAAEILMIQGADVNISDLHGNTPLMLAAENGHTTMCGLLIKYGARVNDRNRQGLSAFDKAAVSGSFYSCGVLLSAGAEVEPFTAAKIKSNPEFSLIAGNSSKLHLFQWSADELLLQGVKSGRFDLIAFALSMCANPSARDRHTRGTPLHFAAGDGNMEIARALIDRGAIIDAGSGCGQTPLYLAVNNGHYEMAKLLLRHGADPCIHDYHWDTPFHLAMENKDLAMIKMMIAQDVNAKDFPFRQYEFLKDAVSNPRTEIAQLLLRKYKNISKHTLNRLLCDAVDPKIVLALLKRGADPNYQDGNGRTALHWSSRNKNAEVAAVLLRHGARVDIRDKFGQTALHEAAENGSRETIELLLDHGADLEARDRNGRTPLLMAIRYSRFEAGATLIKRGAKVNVVDLDGRTPLIGFNDQETREMLVENGAIILTSLMEEKKDNTTILDVLKQYPELARMCDLSGFTPLHQAARDNNLEVARELLKQGAYPNALAEDYRDLTYYYTPLHFAAGKGYEQMRQLLRSYGAVEDIESYFQLIREGNLEQIKRQLDLSPGLARVQTDSNDPICEAAREGHLELCELLLDHGADIDSRCFTWSDDTPFSFAVRNDHYDIVRLLVERGAEVNVSTFEVGCGALAHCAANGDVDLINFLIAHGAEVNRRGCYDGYGSSMLEGAIGGGHPEAVEVVIAAGAYVNQINFIYGDYPIHGAWNPEVAEILLAHGAHLDERGGSGKTVLHFAARNDWVEAAQFFVEKGADVHALDDEWRTPMEESLNWGTMEFFMDQEDEVEARYRDGLTPLFCPLGNESRR